MKNIATIITVLIVGIGIGWFISNKNTLPEENLNEHVHDSGNISSETVWTCSMDPQVRQDEPGDCPICGMDLIPAESMTQNDNPLVLSMSKDAVKLAQIETTVIGSNSMAQKPLRLNGTIKANETKAASLVAHIPGRIEKLFVTYTGEKVNKRQKIATIYAPDLITAQKELLEAQKLIDISPKLVEAAKNKLRFWKISTRQIDQILESGVVQEYFDIYAEHGGIVKTRKVSIGDYLGKGEVLFDIIDLNHLWILFDVYENDLANVKVGSKVIFSTPSVPNKMFNSRISFIDPLINPATRVATVRAEMKNVGQKLKPEMFVSGTINSKIGKQSKQITVPKTAVLWTGDKSVVYLKVQDASIPSYEFREVQLNGTMGDQYIVVNGLEDGDEVVSKGAFMIDASAQLNNQASMMNRRVLAKGEPVQADVIPDFKDEIPEVFKSQLKDLVDAYLVMKTSLVNTDAVSVKASVSGLIKSLKKMDVSLLKGDAHEYWMMQLSAMEAHFSKVKSLNDVEDQRTQFGFGSDALILAIKAFGIPSSDKLYVEHCPMAFDNEGGDWISAEAAIANPYFGDKMMKCGVVKLIINE